MLKRLSVIFVFIIIFLGVAPSAFAVRFELIPPSGQLTRGQEITFTINIDTQDATINTIQTGMTYQSAVLEYVSSAAGAAMDSIAVDTSQGTDKLLFTGTSNAGFNSTGIFATVVFKIIAEEAGSTELCTLWAPTTTVAPTTPAALPTSLPQPTTPPVVPTSLPQTGFDIPKNIGALTGIVFLAAAGGIFYYSKKNTYTSKHPTRKKHK